MRCQSQPEGSDEGTVSPCEQLTRFHNSRNGAEGWIRNERILLSPALLTPNLTPRREGSLKISMSEQLSIKMKQLFPSLFIEL